MKKQIINLITVFSLIIIGCSTSFITVKILSDKKKENTNNELNNPSQNQPSFDVKNNEIVFYDNQTKEKKVISTYHCKKEGCIIGGNQNYTGFDQQTRIALISDNINNSGLEYKADYILFDANKGIELVSSSDIIYPIFNYRYSEENQNQSFKNVAGYRYLNSDNKINLLYGDGTKLVNGHSFDDIYTGIYGNIYLYEKLQYLYLGVKKEGKWGVVDFRSHGNVFLDYKYDDINIFNSYNIAVKKENTWSVIDRYKKEVGTGYQEVYIDGEYYLASINNKVNLYDETGLMIGNINLDLGIPYSNKSAIANGLYLKKENNDQLTISIDYATSKEHTYTQKTYSYDLTTNKLTEKNNN